ncbi:MAG: C2H2-type zinc finger protein [Candidatus Bathyarchaeia archaeon]
MSQGTYVCPACKQFFKTKEELETHAKTAHSTK